MQKYTVYNKGRKKVKYAASRADARTTSYEDYFMWKYMESKNFNDALLGSPFSRRYQAGYQHGFDSGFGAGIFFAGIVGIGIISALGLAYATNTKRD